MKQLLALLFLTQAVACKNGTRVTATQAALDSADQVLIGMTHYVTQEGILRARVQADTAYFYSGTQRAELRNVHVTFYDATGRATSTLTSKEGTHHWRTGDMQARGTVVVIRDKDGDVIGAVGISGDTADNDEICAIAGVQAAGLTPDPGKEPT